ncbi:Phosphomannomutase/phosphoglucomutase [Gammaproteobacteria bacterium]
MSTELNSEIFREYDIRGIADQDLTDSVVENLGRAFAKYLRPKNAVTVAVGYDARMSALRIRDALCRGLNSAGLNVVDLGLCPTPALYFSLFHLSVEAGIMITGSHNPSQYNGFKICVGKETIYGSEIQALRKIMLENKEDIGAKMVGTTKEHPIIPEYVAFLKEKFPYVSDWPITVVVDSGNGTGGLATPEVLRFMGNSVIELFSEPDGRFPNHHPDPTVPKNLASLVSVLKEKHADIGIALDGDSDRIGVVDETGKILWGDQLMVLFARDILRDQPKATFVSEVKCSQNMYDDIRKRGGNPIMWKVGHSLIKAKMKETGAVFAGEMSGHLFFADRYYGYDDAVYAAARIVELLRKTRREQNSKVLMSSLLSGLPKTYSTPEIRIDCPERIKFRVVEQVKNKLSLEKGLLDLITVDGVRPVFAQGWGLLRASNTESVLVLRFESTDAESLKSIQDTLEGYTKETIEALSAL